MLWSVMLEPINGIDPYRLQSYSMFILRFYFEGHRKLIASRVVEGNNLMTELEQAATMLAKCYASKIVRLVDLVAYDMGYVDVFNWPEGLELLSQVSEQTILNQADAA